MKTKPESYRTLREADRDLTNDDSNWSIRFPRTQREAGWNETAFASEEYRTPWLAWLCWGAVGFAVWSILAAIVLTFR